jgi:hypothetical protein
MTCTCGQPTEGGALLCGECTRRALASISLDHIQFPDLEDDAMPPGAEGAD